MDHSDKLCKLCEPWVVQRRWPSHGEITVCPIVSKRQFTASLISSREKDLRGGTILGVDDLSDTFSLLLTKEKVFVWGAVRIVTSR